MEIKHYENSSHTKHLAFQIAAQLPEEIHEALKVLEYVRKLVLQPLDDAEVVTQLKIVRKD